MRVKPRKIKEKDKKQSLDALYTTMGSLQNYEDIKTFLRELLTEGEKIMIGRRILIAQRLLKDESYLKIMGEMKVGPDTIMRVHRWLENDSNGYEKAIATLEPRKK